MRIGTQELMIILVIALLIFGPKQLPKLAKMFGKATKNFKDGIDAADEEDTKAEAKAAKAEEDDE